MPEPEVLTAPPAQGLPVEPGSQPTEPTPQGTAQPEPTAAGQVEPTEPSPSNPQTGRPKPSDFYGFRKENQQLKEQLRAQQSQIDEILKSRQPPAPQGPKVPDYLQPDKFWENTPENLMRLKEETRKEALEEFKQSFPKLYEETKKSEQLQGRALEAMELILPKDKAGIETLEQRHKKGIDKVSAVFEIMEREGLNYIPDPVIRTKHALRIYDEEIKAQQPARPVNPNAIEKKLMGGTPSAQPVGGGKKMPTLTEARTELKRLVDLRDKNPDIKFEDTYKQQLAQAKQTLSELVVKEQGGVNQ